MFVFYLQIWDAVNLSQRSFSRQRVAVGTDTHNWPKCCEFSVLNEASLSIPLPPLLHEAHSVSRNRVEMMCEMLPSGCYMAVVVFYVSTAHAEDSASQDSSARGGGAAKAPFLTEEVLIANSCWRRKIRSSLGMRLQLSCPWPSVQLHTHAHMSTTSQT